MVGQKPELTNAYSWTYVTIWRDYGVNTQPLQCTATGESPLTYEWYKDNKLTSVRLPEYNIAHFQPRDNGEYRCKVSNIHGYAEETFIVYVVGE